MRLHTPASTSHKSTPFTSTQGCANLEDTVATAAHKLGKDNGLSDFLSKHDARTEGQKGDSLIHVVPGCYQDRVVC